METYSREMLQSLSKKEVQIERGIRESVANHTKKILIEVVNTAIKGGVSHCARGPFRSGWSRGMVTADVAGMCAAASTPGYDILDDLVRSLTDHLPRCDIQTDPLKTYILIQWG